MVNEKKSSFNTMIKVLLVISYAVHRILKEYAIHSEFRQLW